MELRYQHMHEELRKVMPATKPFSFRVKVIPKSARNEIVGTLVDGTIKVKIAATPEKGKANAELCSFLAREFELPQSRVEVIAGRKSPLKVVRVTP